MIGLSGLTTVVQELARGKLWWLLLKRFFVSKIACKTLVWYYAIKGNYPWWMITPDDPVSPFGSGTTPTASTEETQMAIYKWFGRYIGDIIWLGWRNSGYGYAYSQKPDWLKDPNIKYEELDIWGTPDREVYLKQPDGSWLWEKTYKVGPFRIITGWRLTPILNGANENKKRLEQGLERAARPAFHPNMDARPVISLRTSRTL